MKLRKVLTTVLAAVTACSLLLTGCQQKLAPADQVVSALFALEAQGDAAPMKDLLGFASEDDVNKSMMEDGAGTNFVDELKQELVSAGIEFTDDELQDMTDQLMGLLAKVSCTTEITAQSGKETTVDLKVKGYSMEDVNKIATDLGEKSASELDEDTQQLIASGDADAYNKYMQQFMKDYIAALGTMEPTKENDITVKMEKVKADVSGKTKLCWWPVDMNKFNQEMNNALMN